MGKRIALIFALCACGGGGGTSDGSVNGTIGGVSFPVASAISAIVPTEAGTSGVVGLTNADDACSQIETNNTHPDQTTVLVQLFDIDEASQSESAPTAPGTYTVFNEIGSASPSTTSVAVFVAEVDGSNCTSTGEAHGMSGTVTLTTADATSGVYAGTFDVTFETGDRVTGDFNPTACPALAGSGGSGSATCD